MSEFSRLAYEHLLYTLPQQYPQIASSSLHLFTTSAAVGLVRGSVQFHTPPDIKHNRKPAPGISFAASNLATLIEDCIALGERG